MPKTKIYVNENSVEGSNAGSPLLSSDPDEKDQGFLKHTLPGPPFPFYVDQQMQTKVSFSNFIGPNLLNAECKMLYSYNVYVSDLPGPNGNFMSSYGNLTIEILNLNEAPYLKAQLLAFYVLENATIGTVVGKVNAFDQDFGTMLRYSIEGGDPGRQFRIVQVNTDPFTAHILTENFLILIL
eukprot:g2094.t1